MNILLVNHYAGSDKLGMEFRPFYLAKEWEKQGHHTTIVAASYSHIRAVNPDLNRRFLFEEIDGIEYLWLKTPSYHTNSAKRFLNMLIFVFRLFCIMKKLLLRKKYDVVIASSTYPLDIFPARRIAKKSNAQLIFEVHDLWPLSPMELGGYSKWHPFIMIMQYAENFAYRYADKVVSMLPKTKEHMMAHGLQESKWFYIPNGICLDEWENNVDVSDDVKQTINQIRLQFNTIVAYTGTYGVANALDTFLDASKFLKNESTAFVMFGKGPLKLHLQSRVINEKLENVFIFNSVPKQAIPRLLSLFDMLFIGSHNQHNLYRFGISPNKMMDYMMSGKPIINAINAGNDLVADAGCGLSIEPENPKAITDAINKLKAMPQETVNAYGKNGKEYILANHTFAVLSANFIDIIIK